MKIYNRKHIGEVWRTNEGYDCKVIDGGSKRCFNTIQIGNWTSELQYQQIKDGRIKYPFKRTVYNIGYFGNGKHKAKIKNEQIKSYKIWQGILQRCYDAKFQKKHPTYKNIVVCKKWHNYQNFAKWFEKNYREGYELDKDLLSEPDNKIYSPDTCIFIPKKLNSFLANKLNNNTSGHIGVNRGKKDKKWIARIGKNKKRKYIGYFDSIIDASKAYHKARKEEADAWRDKMQGILSDKAIRCIA